MTWNNIYLSQEWLLIQIPSVTANSGSYTISNENIQGAADCFHISKDQTSLIKRKRKISYGTVTVQKHWLTNKNTKGLCEFAKTQTEDP